MAVTYASFIILFPEFTTSDSGEQARITTYIAAAVLDVSTDSWGGKADLGISYLAAHRLALANRTKETGVSASVGAGPVIDAKAKNLSVKYGNPVSVGSNTPFYSAGLASTPYGLVYAEMRSTLSITPLTT